MGNFKNRFYLGVLIFLGALFSGQNTNDVTSVPPPPLAEESAGGEGAMPSPVDMYVVFLAIIAVMFIVYFVRQYNNKKVA